MTDKDLYGGLIRLHILHHAAEEPVFGLGIIEELRRHGYEMSAGTVYPMLHGTVAKLAMRQPFVLFKGLTFQKLCLPGAFRPGDHHN
ncbi:PadR family transcriptional regulator, partial [Klebsiella pneumoniae]|uniref:PadR family transcriptional regulator n=2 Tax=Enterobacterales TaxID=91347 RepID=UPI0021585C31